ncbi:hypothetical protein [Oceanicoccus sp. KOV_DT_Chl]|uniref:hypothetical protein n=1 Tax=Oceanicoccus sp. KOV_DT_Chl TaxID=1904639 RepID=UPI000C7991E4|nr:hypothetical protein [Oceanicoccus sp. KOV_DT_Chl]
MKHLLSLKSSLVLLTIIASQSAFSAGYLKFDGIDGESTEKSGAPSQQTPSAVSSAQKPPSALLLPAVQAAREAARTKGGNAETTWKVEKGEK